MFYSSDLLSRKGLLAKVWLAGTQRSAKTLSKKALSDLNVPALVAHITNPSTPLALRAEAVLLLGIALIHDRQTSGLLLAAHDLQFLVGLGLARPFAPQSGSAASAGTSGTGLAAMMLEHATARREALTIPTTARAAGLGALTGTDVLATLFGTASTLRTLPAFVLPHMMEGVAESSPPQQLMYFDAGGLDDSIEVARGGYEALLEASSTRRSISGARSSDISAMAFGALGFGERIEIELGNEDLGWGGGDEPQNNYAMPPAAPGTESAPQTDVVQLAPAKKRRTVQKRLIVDVDDEIEIPAEEMRAQIADASDLLVDRPIYAPQSRPATVPQTLFADLDVEFRAKIEALVKDSSIAAALQAKKGGKNRGLKRGREDVSERAEGQGQGEAQTDRMMLMGDEERGWGGDEAEPVEMLRAGLNSEPRSGGTHASSASMRSMHPDLHDAPEFEGTEASLQLRESMSVSQYIPSLANTTTQPSQVDAASMKFLGYVRDMEARHGSDGRVPFLGGIVSGARKGLVARAFYRLCILAGEGLVDVEQQQPMGEIHVICAAA